MGKFLINKHFLKKNFFIVFLIILLPFSSIALDESSFIKLVLTKNNLFLKSEIDMFLQQKRLQNKEADYYGWHFDITSKYSIRNLKAKKDNPNKYDYINNQVQNNKYIALNASLAFKNGISFSSKLSRDIKTNKYDKYRNLEYRKSYSLNEYGSELSTNINIPLLKNRNGGDNKYYYDNAKIDKKIEWLELLEDKEEIVFDKLEQFIELSITIDKLNIARNYLTDISNILQKIENKKSLKNDILLTKNKIIKINRIIADQQIIINKIKTKLSKEVNFNNIKLSDIDFNYKIRTNLIKNINNHLVSNNRDLIISKLDIQKKINTINNLKNKKLADLDFNIWTINSRDKGSYSYYSYYDKNDFGVSIDFYYPLGGTSSNDYSLLYAQMSYKKKQLDYADDLQDKLEDIQNLNAELRSKNNNLKSFIRQIKTTPKDVELKKYLSNGGSIKPTLSEIDDFYDLKLEYIDKELEYHIKRIEYDNFLDRLLPTNNLKCDFCLRNK